MSILTLIGRANPLFENDIRANAEELKETVSASRFLVIGGAGSIGQSVVKEIFKLNPKLLHVVDISENNLVELVRDIRSTMGYIDGDFKTYAIDCGGYQMEALVAAEGPYDYVFNLSALKHVRSERDPYTLMRMLEVNIFNTLKTLNQARCFNATKYFCVSTDKAANPANVMGASKRIMEMFLMRESLSQEISTARFANVAFSDGSLLHGFNQRLAKLQPIAAPRDVRRYFVTQQEAGELCLMSGIFGKNRDIFFPKLDQGLHLTSFSDIAIRYLNSLGYEVFECESENEARKYSKDLIGQKKWPCYFFNSDTTGEKDFEEFFTSNEVLDLNEFESIGIIKNDPIYEEPKLRDFLDALEVIKNKGSWSRVELVDLIGDMIPNFSHKETGKYLDQKM
jgi:FlaA1/EpsC-like NDP-sugar epimerase